MGKAARAVCIFMPLVLTAASLACIILISISGWSSKGILSEFYFFKANFTDLDVMAPNLPSDALTAALKNSAEKNKLARVYQVHLYNFCERNSPAPVVTYCSPEMGDYYFDPLKIWNLLPDNSSAMTKDDEIQLLGEKAQTALDAYRALAVLMFVFYQISFWATVATVLCGVLAFWRRFGSYLTWLLSVVRIRSLYCNIPVINNGNTDRFNFHPHRCGHEHSNFRRFRQRHERDPPPLQCSSGPGYRSICYRRPRRRVRLGWRGFLAAERLLLLRSKQSSSSFEQRRTLELEAKQLRPRQDGTRREDGWLLRRCLESLPARGQGPVGDGV